MFRFSTFTLIATSAIFLSSCKDQSSDSASTPLSSAEQAVETKTVHQIAQEFVDSMHRLPDVLESMVDDESTTVAVAEMKKVLDESKAIMDQLDGLEQPSNEDRKALDDEMTEKSDQDARRIFVLLTKNNFELSPKAKAELKVGMGYFQSIMVEITPAVEKYFKPDPESPEATVPQPSE